MAKDGIDENAKSKGSDKPSSKRSLDNGQSSSKDVCASKHWKLSARISFEPRCCLPLGMCESRVYGSVKL